MKAFRPVLLASILGAVFALTAEHCIGSAIVNEAKAADQRCVGIYVSTGTLTAETAPAKLGDEASALVSNGYRIVGFGGASYGYNILACK